MELNRTHGIVQVAVHIGIKPPPAIGTDGWNPICEIKVDALSNETLYNAFVGYEVQDVGTFDQRVDQQQWDRLGLRRRLVVAQSHLPCRVDDLVGSNWGRIFVKRKRFSQAVAKTLQGADSTLDP